VASERLMAEGVLCKETHERTLRIAPPLTIERADLDWAIDRLCEVLA
jgi:ornithine--oxo-acid transaminase